VSGFCWGRSCSWHSPWKASLPARDCKASMKMMTCSRRWRGNWSRETASAIAPMPFGEPSVQNTKSCFQRILAARMKRHPSKCRDILLEPQPDPTSLVEGAMDTASIAVFGQRPQALSGKRRRGRPAVPERHRYSASAERISGPIAHIRASLRRMHWPKRALAHFAESGRGREACP
jgi:hypothetical protein